MGTKLREPLVDVHVAADLLGVSEGTLYGWVRLRQIPSYKLAGLVRFRLSELEAWVEANRRAEPVA